MQPRKITKGGNCPICSADQSIGPLLIRLDWTLQGIPPGDIDVSLFLLNQDGNVARDADFIFYNQPVSTTGQVRHLSMADPDLGDGKAGFWVDIARLPDEVDRLAISLTHHGEGNPIALKALLAESILEIQWREAEAGISYAFTDDLHEETALIVGEIYRHVRQWKFRAIGQGFVGGLAALATHFGVCLQEGTASESGNTPQATQSGVSLQTRRKRRTPAEILAEQCQQLKVNLDRFLPQIHAACQAQENETRTRMILDRVFQDVLGYGMESIKTEQNIQGRRADYVLSSEGQDVLVVEVKRAGMSMRERQIFQATSYGAYSGIHWALLTNLVEWQLYRISTGDKIEANQVFCVNLKQGVSEDSAYRLTLISAYGFSRKGLLDKLWLKLSTLSYERLAAALLNQEVVGKIRSILSKESGISLTQEEVQTAVERNLLHLD